MSLLVDISKCPSVSWQEIYRCEIGRLQLVNSQNFHHQYRKMWPHPADVIDKVDEAKIAPFPINLYSLKNCELRAGSHLMQNGALVFAEDILASYVASYYDAGRVIIPPAERTIIVDCAFVLFSFQSKDYGHFLLETLPKVFALRAVFDLGHRFPVIVPHEIPEYCLEALSAHLPDIEYIRLEIGTNVNLGRALLPSMANMFYFYHDGFLAMMRDFGARAAVKAAILPERIYVSREGLGSSIFPRTMGNEDEVLDVLLGQGYTKVVPHNLAWSEKLATFSSARVVVSEYGSGLHNVLLCRPGTCVVALNWRDEVQQRIARSCGLALGFILADDEQVRYFTDENTKYRVEIKNLMQKIKVVEDAFYR